MSDQNDVSLSQAVTMYLATLTQEQKQDCQLELNRLVRWFGGERVLREIKAAEVGKYSDGIGFAVTDMAKRLEPVRGFFAYASKNKLTERNLATHVRVTKAKQSRSTRKRSVEVAQVTLTPEGYAALEAELEALKAERPRISEQIRVAAADKDFRENAPLEAAREHQGQVEARIRDLEAVLKGASMVEQQEKTGRGIGVGCTVSLCDLASGEEERYTLVSPSEANPMKGKLSIASPIGRALLDQEVGAIVEVEAPVGKLRYRIERVEG